LTINDLFFRLRHDEREIGADRADRPIDIANTGGTRQMNKHIRDNVIFVFVATAAFLSEPTIANAQTDPYNPVNFTEPLSLYRGKISPVSPDSLYFDDEDRCNILMKEWGWASCDGIEAMIVGLAPGIDTLMVETANSDGRPRKSGRLGRRQSSGRNRRDLERIRRGVQGPRQGAG
jgi:hypothetical protein